MAREKLTRSINIKSIPELLRLAEEARRDNRVIVLTDDGEEVARLTPRTPKPRRPRRKPSPEDIEAFLSAAGGWKEVDTDKLIEDIYESRARSSRPAVDL